MAPDAANKMYEDFVAYVRDKGIHTETGEFGADMKVTLTNDGPVTIILDSER
jgi:D-tyrosyl-tRNA(Tyr) deacylase